MKTLSTEDIVNGIRQKNNDVIKYIYREYFPIFSTYVHNNHGNIGDSEDVFQEALVVIYKNLRDNRSLKIKDFTAYILAITNFIWRKKMRDNAVIDKIPLEIDELDDLIDNSDAFNIESDLKMGLYQKHFLSLDEESKKVLQLFFAKIPMYEIANVMGYSSEEYAKKRKYLAQRTLIARIKSDPDYSID